MSIFNPLDHVFETRKYPLSRTYRTSFGRKIIDTFEMFAGFPSEHDAIHAGIFDYLTLGIPTIIFLINLGFFKAAETTGGKIALGIPLLLISVPLMLIRLTFAAVLTLACLPFIGIANAIASFEGDRLKNDITSHIITEKTELAANSTAKQLPFRDVLKNSNTSIENISRIENTDANNGARHLRFFKEEKDTNPIAEFKLNLRDTTQKITYKALCKLNIGKIQHDIENPPTATPAPR